MIEQAPQVMATLDADMAGHVQDAAEALGVRVVLGAGVEEIVLDDAGAPVAVRTADAPYDADHVVIGTGSKPAVELAAAAGLEVGDSGALRVDDRQRCPGHDGVFAAGDCAESHHRVLDAHVNIQLGTHANKQGRIAGVNATGGDDRFPGVIGTAVSKICRYEVGRTGIGEQRGAAGGDRGRRRDDQGPHARRLLPGRRPDLGQARRRARQRPPARRPDRRRGGRRQAHRRPRDRRLVRAAGPGARAARPVLRAAVQRRLRPAADRRAGDREAALRRAQPGGGPMRLISRGRSSTSSSPRCVPRIRTAGERALLHVDLGAA